MGGFIFFFPWSSNRVSFSSITKMKGYLRVTLDPFQDLNVGKHKNAHLSKTCLNIPKIIFRKDMS